MKRDPDSIALMAIVALLAAYVTLAIVTAGATR
jgi:hypothetical protein